MFSFIIKIKHIIWETLFPVIYNLYKSFLNNLINGHFVQKMTKMSDLEGNLLDLIDFFYQPGYISLYFDDIYLICMQIKTKIKSKF